MKKYIIYVFDKDLVEFEEVENFEIPENLPIDCLYFYFISAIFDVHNKVFLEQKQESECYYINAQIVPVECLSNYCSGKQLDSIQERLKEFENRNLDILKLSNGDMTLTNANEISIFMVSQNPIPAFSGDSLNGNKINLQGNRCKFFYISQVIKFEHIYIFTKSRYSSGFFYLDSLNYHKEKLYFSYLSYEIITWKPQLL